MDEMLGRQMVAETGRILLEKGLVARTWGNISARVNEKQFAVSPSGLGYEYMGAEDVPVFDMETGTFTGSRKPSSEKLIHAAAYQIYPEVQFVIHTHQDYATAVGLVGTGGLKLNAEEAEILGKIEIASYGLPGTKKLGKNVADALKKDAKVVLMKHHGALILGDDREDTIQKAELLEQVCRRAVDAKCGANDLVPTEQVDEKLLRASENMLVHTSPDILKTAELGGFVAQLDDMAQMLGRKLRAVSNDPDAILHALNRSDAVLVKNVGCVILTEQKDDAGALAMLLNKAAIAKNYTLACGVNTKLSAFDCCLMRNVYKMKYSKKKEG